MLPIIVYTAYQSPRLQYVLDYILHERLGLTYRLVHETQALAGLPFYISYGESVAGGISLPDSGLLREKDIRQQNIHTGIWQNLPVFFYKEDTDYTLPFDLFSAVFFLISRYEEYDNWIPDQHGRYPATESILFRNGWLERPLVDEWLTAFTRLLCLAQVPVSAGQFAFIPTYDIDIAYSHRYKGIIRSSAALIREGLQGKWLAAQDRIETLTGRKADPYDSFSRIEKMHTQYSLTPHYFILVSLHTTAFDKNNHPLHPAMRQLVRQLDREGITGMHPSYFSANPAVFKAEKDMLEAITGHPVQHSRQHYIRMKLPDTMRQLISHAIMQDYSMGYGTHLGFRAGTGMPFRWYDLAAETVSPLTIHPFCFMDTTARFEARLDPEAAYTRMLAMRQVLQQNHSRMITVFHNFSLGTDAGWKGWPEMYARFLHTTSANDETAASQD